METVRVNKAVLIEKMIENRDAHREIFLKAVEGYKRKGIEVFEDHLERLRNGDLMEISVKLPMPKDHTNEYNVAIGMLEMSEDDVVEISEFDYSQYVLDNWNWKKQFVATSDFYVA